MGTEKGQKNTRDIAQSENLNGNAEKSCRSSTLSKDVSSHVYSVPVTVDESNVIEGAKEILRIIRPSWNINDVDFKLFTDGITNKLIGCFHKTPSTTSTSSSNNEQQSTSLGAVTSLEDYTDQKITGTDNDVESSQISKLKASSSTSSAGTTASSSVYDMNVVLVRVYGNKTDLLIDRKAETRNIKLLHSYGFAPSLFAVFNNGLAYEYVPGVTLTPESVREPNVYTLIAKRMAEMHKVDCGNKIQRTSMLWSKTQQFLNLIPANFDDPVKHERLKETFLPVQKLRQEFEELYSRLETLNSPIVFCHNDLLLGNVIYTENLNRVTFIDFEYAQYNFQAFDIGNHFTEFAGIDEIDYSRYPSKEFQFDWLREYLQTYLDQNDVSALEIEKLYVQVNQFALASHFFWAVWALIQAQHSTIDFDFVQFAFARYNEYLSKRELFLSLENPESETNDTRL